MYLAVPLVLSTAFLANLMKAIIRICCCVAWLLSLSVHAIQTGNVITDTIRKIDPLTGNFTDWQTFTLPFSGSESDFSATDIQVGGLFYDVNCQVKVSVECSLDSFTPKERRLFGVDTCILENTRQLNTSAVPADMPFPDNTIHSRRLLQLNHDRSLKGVAPLLIAGWIGAGIGSIASGQSPICGMTLGLFGCKESDSGPTPNPEQIEQIRALDAFAAGMVKFSGLALEGLTNQQIINLGNFAVVKNLQGQVDTLISSAESLRQNDELLARRIDLNYNTTQRQFSQVYDTIAAGINTNAAYTDARSAQLEAAMLRNDRAIINVTKAIAANVSENDRFAVRRDRRITRSQRQLTNMFFRARMNRDKRRAISKGIWQKIKEAEDQGYVVYKHPHSPGSAPTPYSQLQLFDKQVLIDKMYINMVNKTSPTSAIAMARQLGVTVYARQDAMIDNQGVDASWEDIVDLIGPAGCIRNATLDGVPIVDRCNAWFEITHKRCRPKAGFHWKDISDDPNLGDDRDAYVLGPNICFNGGNPVNDVWNGRKFDSHADWLVLFKPLPCYPLLSAAPAHLWQFISIRKGRWNLPAPTSNAVCDFDVNRIFETSLFANTLPFTLYASLQYSYAAFLLDVQLPFENKRYGVIPNWFDHEQIQFMYAEDGRFYECTRTMFIAVKPETVPVHHCSTQDTLPVCTITAYNRPVICPGCPPRVAQTVEKTSEVTVTLAKPGSLPQAGDLIFGEWTGTGLTSIIDAPRGVSGPITGNGEVRANKIPYLRIPVPENFDYPSAVSFPEDMGDVRQWFELYGPKFSHYKAAVSPDLFLRDLTLSGRCEQVGGVPLEWGCQLLDDYSVHSTTDMRSGLLVLQPKEFRFDGRMTVVGSKVIKRVFDGCPEFNFVQYTDQTADLRYINSLPFELTITVRKTSTLCQFGDVIKTLEAHKFFQEDVPACGNFSVEIFTATGPNGALVPCQDQPKRIIINPASNTAVSRFVVGGFNQTFIVDTVGAGLIAMSEELTEVINSIQDIVPILVDVNITPADKTAAANTSLAALLAKIEQIKQGLSLTQGSAIGDLAANNIKLLADNKLLKNQSATNAALLATLQVALAKQDVIIANLTTVQAENVVLQARLHEANLALIAALQQRVDANEKCSSSLFSGWDTSCGIGHIATKAISLVLFSIAIVAIIYLFFKFVIPAVSKGATTSASRTRAPYRPVRRDSRS